MLDSFDTFLLDSCSLIHLSFCLILTCAHPATNTLRGQESIKVRVSKSNPFKKWDFYFLFFIVIGIYLICVGASTPYTEEREEQQEWEEWEEQQEWEERQECEELPQEEAQRCKIIVIGKTHAQMKPLLLNFAILLPLFRQPSCDHCSCVSSESINMHLLTKPRQLRPQQRSYQVVIIFALTFKIYANDQQFNRFRTYLLLTK